jgi:DNA-binding transcriptional LysR family regulator
MKPASRAKRPEKLEHTETERFVRRVDWNLFRQFHEIVQSGSLSGAARRLQLHQPTLSAALKRLEDHLGVTLCHRTAQGIALTPAGKELLQLTTDMMEAVRLAPKLTSQAAKRIEGKMSMRMITYIICPELDEALSSIHGRHPDIEIMIEVSPWQKVVDALLANECDVGITFDARPQALLRYEPLFRETQQLYCCRSHELYGQVIREPAQLSQQRFILTQGDEPDELRQFRERYGLAGNASGRAEDLHEASRLILRGIGIGFLPTVVGAPHGTERLWPLFPPPILPNYFIYLVSHPPERVSVTTQLFLDEMRRRLRARGDSALL